MEALASLVLVTCYVVTGLYVVVAACVASCCLFAVGAPLVREVAREAIDYVTYGT